MTVSVEDYIPNQIGYPDEDGKPMAEGDIQQSSPFPHLPHLL